MKRKILSAALFVAIAVAAGWSVNQGENKITLSELGLSNVEALASDESGSDSYKCYSILEGSGQSVACTSCQLAEGTPPWYHFGDRCKSY